MRHPDTCLYPIPNPNPCTHLEVKKTSIISKPFVIRHEACNLHSQHKGYFPLSGSCHVYQYIHMSSTAFTYEAKKEQKAHNIILTLDTRANELGAWHWPWENIWQLP